MRERVQNFTEVLFLMLVKALETLLGPRTSEYFWKAVLPAQMVEAFQPEAKYQAFSLFC